MCQYFWIPAGETVDEEKLRSSVIVNPHGWGMVYRPKPKGNGPWPFKKIAWAKEGEDNDPDILVELINKKYKDFDRLVHLRFVTKGEHNEENTHPFLVFENKKTKDQVWMAHNGTLHSFAPSSTTKDSRSDTRVFAEEFLAPLFECVKNPASVPSPIMEYIDTKVTGFNRVIFVTSRRRYPVIFNHSKHYFEWKDTKRKDKKTGKPVQRVAWFAANEYSFNPDHRKKKEVVSATVYQWPDDSGFYGSMSQQSCNNHYKSTKRCGLAFAAFKRERAKEGDSWADTQLERFKKRGITGAYKVLAYYGSTFVTYAIRAELTFSEETKFRTEIEAAKKAEESFRKHRKETFISAKDLTEKDDGPYEKFSDSHVTIGGDFVHRWPPSSEDYQKEHERLSKKDPYSKFIYPKVRMFFESEVDNMRALSRKHAVRVWLVNNRKHFDVDDVVATITTLSTVVEKMYADICELEDLLEETGKSAEEVSSTDNNTSKTYRYGLM